MRTFSLLLEPSPISAAGITGAAEPAAVADALARGKVSLHARRRHDGLNQAGLRNSCLTVAASLPGGFALAAFPHRFALERTGSHIGAEFAS